MSEGQARTFAWRQGTIADPTLTSISVFDSRKANVHVDATNDLAYTPAPLKIMAALADTCQTLKLKLAGEVKALQDQTPELLREPEFGPNTAVGELLSKLSATTEPQKVEDLAELSDAEAGELRSLESALAANPTKIVLALQTNKAAIEAFQEKLKALNAATQEEQIQELVGLKKALDDAKKAADLASSDLFSDEPLSDIRDELEDSAIAEILRSSSLQNAWRLRSLLKRHAVDPESDWPKAEHVPSEEVAELLAQLSNRIAGLTAEAGSSERQNLIARRD